MCISKSNLKKSIICFIWCMLIWLLVSIWLLSNKILGQNIFKTCYSCYYCIIKHNLSSICLVAITVPFKILLSYKSAVISQTRSCVMWRHASALGRTMVIMFLHKKSLAFTIYVPLIIFHTYIHRSLSV